MENACLFPLGKMPYGNGSAVEQLPLSIAYRRVYGLFAVLQKNNDLSPEKREKVKAQLTQCGNRHKDVFAKDYADWVLREATGAMKLNRVAREILFTYCPLAPQIAEGLLAQNAYRDAARRYMIEKGKREKEINQVLHRFEKAGMDLPEEVEQTRRFVLDLQGA